MWKNSRLLFAVKVTLNLSYMRQKLTGKEITHGLYQVWKARMTQLHRQHLVE